MLARFRAVKRGHIVVVHDSYKRVGILYATGLAGCAAGAGQAECAVWLSELQYSMIRTPL
jgi:hypothetical protein